MYESIRTKQRGQRRKLDQLLNHINQVTTEYSPVDDYEHFHVPCRNDFLDSPNTSGYVKRKFCQIWLDKTLSFINNKPSDIEFCKIVCMVSPKFFWNSQIIIFYDDQYYETFWNRHNEYQSWIKISGKSYKDAFVLETNMKEVGFIEEINEEDCSYIGELWFYGEVDV